MQEKKDVRQNAFTRLRNEIRSVQTPWQQPAFQKLVRAFAAACPGAFGCSFQPITRKTGARDQLLALDGTVEFAGFMLVFQFTMTAQTSHNVLELLLRFDKTRENPFCYTLYDLFNLLGIADFHCYTYGALYNEALLQEAFTDLTRALERYLPHIMDVSKNPADQKKLRELLNDDYFISFRQPLKDVARHPQLLARSLHLFYAARRCLHLSGAYLLLCKGKRESALRRLRRSNALCLYQQRLLHWLEQGSTHEDPLLPPALQRAALQGERLLPQLLSVLCYTTVFSAPFFLLFCLLFYAAQWLLGVGSLYVLHLTPYALMLPAMLAAFLFVCFSRHILILQWRPGKRRERFEMEWMRSGKHNRRFLKHVTTALYMLLVVVFVFYAACNLTFLPEGLRNNNSFFSLQGEYIPYEQVQALEVTMPIVLPDGTYIRMESYRLRLKDGRQISLLRYDPWRIQEHVVPLLREHSDIELPRAWNE